MGRREEASAVEQPVVTDGSWVGGGGVVLERSFADALGVRVGDRMTLAGRDLRVRGIAVTVSRGFVPARPAPASPG